jgi:hypothetical protein
MDFRLRMILWIPDEKPHSMRLFTIPATQHP